MATLTGISACTVTACSFNSEQSCNAGAITVAGTPDHAECGTFISLDVRGGLPTALLGAALQRKLAVALVHEKQWAGVAHD